MKGLSNTRGRFRRRGQVFILAVLLILVYAVSLVSILSNLSVTKANKNESVDLNQFLSDFLFEFEQYQTVVLARITQYQSLYTQANGTADINVFLNDYESFLLNASIIMTASNTPPLFSPDVRSDFSSGSPILQTLVVSVQTQLDLRLSASLSSDEIQVSHAVFVGFRVEYNQTAGFDSQFTVTRIDKNSVPDVIMPILGASIFLGNPPPGSPTPTLAIPYNGIYQVAANVFSNIRLPNGVNFFM